VFQNCRLPVLLIASSTLFAQSAARLELGRLQTGATVSFARSTDGNWGIEISGLQRRPSGNCNPPGWKFTGPMPISDSSHPATRQYRRPPAEWTPKLKFQTPGTCSM